jgi:competence protein ComEC
MQTVSKILFLWILGIVLSSFVQASFTQWVLFLIALSILFTWIHVKFRFMYLENLLLVLVLLCTVQILDGDCFGVDNDRRIGNGEYKVLLKVMERYGDSELQYKYIVNLQAVFCDSLVLVNDDCLLMQQKGPRSIHYYPGDRFYASVYAKDFPKSKHPALFDFGKYWALKGVEKRLWMNEKPIKIIEYSKSWYYVIRSKQAYLIELLDRQPISVSTREILSALLLGDKRGVSNSLRDRFSNLGLSHILALSGLHIGLIYGFFASFFGFILRSKPNLKSMCLILIIGLYAILTGASASVIRASLMFVLYALCLFLNRRANPFNIVFMSALFLLIYNSNLLYDIGFQLSYLAVLGILYFHRVFKNSFDKIGTLRKYVLGIVLMTVSAQLSTGILSIFYFKCFSTSFLWANLIFLPLFTLLLYFSGFYLLQLLLGIRLSFVERLLDSYVESVLTFLTFVESLSFAPLLINLTYDEMLYFYGLIILCCLVFLENKFNLLRVLYMYILLGTYSYYFERDENVKELFVNSSKSALVISISANEEQVVLTNDFNSVGYLLGDYSLINKINCVDTLSLNPSYKNSFISVLDSYVYFFDRKLIIVEDQEIASFTMNDADVVILRSYREDMLSIMNQFSPEVVLLDARISSNHRYRMKELGLAQDIQIIDLKDEVYTLSF